LPLRESQNTHRIKRYRCISTRYEKLTKTLLGFVSFAAVLRKITDEARRRIWRLTRRFVEAVRGMGFEVEQ